jgi:hypothetical protein
MSISFLEIRVGWIMSIFDKVFNKTNKVVLNKAQSTIDRLIKEFRLNFKDNDTVVYTDRHGNVILMKFLEFANYMLDQTGHRSEAESYTSIRDTDIVEILNKEYQKSNGGK